MLDGSNNEITYLRVSVTDRCNLRCRYCMPAHGVKFKPPEEILTYEEIASICSIAAGIGITKIRLTGGEPLVRKNITRLVWMLDGIPGIKELCLTTNGTLLAPVTGQLKTAGMARINISLDTLNAGKYRYITRGGDIREALSGIESAKKWGFQKIKINMVLIPGFNTCEIDDMMSFCRENGLILQRINRYSLRSGLDQNCGLGAERPPDCRTCNRLRLTADGKLKPCLFSREEIAVDLDDIESSLRSAVRRKRPWRRTGTERGNWEIGG